MSEHNTTPNPYASDPNSPRSKYERKNPVRRDDMYTVSHREVGAQRFLNSTAAIHIPSERALQMRARADALSHKHALRRAGANEQGASGATTEQTPMQNGGPQTPSAPSQTNPAPNTASSETLAASASSETAARTQKARRGTGARNAGTLPTVTRSISRTPDSRANTFSYSSSKRGGWSKHHLYYAGPKRNRASIARFFAPIALVALIVVVGVYNLIVSPLFFEATLNGQTVKLHRGDTIESIMEDNLAAPQAGNLIAVDRTVLEQGQGEPFFATINDQETADASTRVYKNDVIVIADGADIMEDYNVETLTTDFESKVENEASGAIHAYIEGAQGVTERRTGKVSGITHDELISPVVNNGFIKYNADTNGEKVIALTFDDGPWPETTEEVLAILAENDAKATFFTVGTRVEDRPDLVKQAYDAGHQICTHTYDHAAGSGGGVDITAMTAEEQVSEIQKGYDAIQAALGVEVSNIIRAPGGNYSGSVIWTLEPYVSAEIGWNIDTEDWRQPGADAIAQAIKGAKAGDIVLMHDGGGDRSQTVEALRTALPYLKSQGYRFVTIDELMAYNNPSEVMVSMQKASDSSKDATA